ncbi:WXG100 family type VII secretion target [Nocardia rhizosphaerae]|uniref:WXG100 family type VII secretion target n=1 Tax=Nocardia rhizosphaerae TaxID=1691571 RepID=A0ABV8L4P3_9NOCA
MVFEDPQITAKESPKEFSHEQINNAFNPLQPTDNAVAAAGQYSQIAQKWRQGVTDFAARMNRASAAAWDGVAAETTRTAITNYTQRAAELTPELEALATRVGETAQAITTTKENLPEVVEPFSWGSPTTWFGLKDDERDDAEEKAREVMGNHYVTPFGTADGGVPKLPTPISPTNPLHPTIDDDGSGGGNTDDSTGGGTDDGDDPATTDPATTETPTDEQESTTEDTTTDDESESTDEDDTAGDDDTTASSTTPTDTSTNPAGTSPTTPSTLTPGGTTGSPGGGGSSGAPGSGSPSAPTPGGTVAGSPGSGTPGSNAAAAGAARGGTGRMGMPGMMGAPGARGKGEGDDEHKLPDYLVNAENTEELLGEQPRTIAGGVIGGDAPSATTPAPPQH